MTPSTYLVAVPLGLIAISGWLVKVENDSFSKTTRTSRIQQVATYTGTRTTVGIQAELPPESKLTHDRFAWDQPDGESPIAPLGHDLSVRPLGARGGRPQQWLDEAPLKPVSKTSKLPDIEGYRSTPPVADPAFEPVPPESGFHITADEATKVDMGAEKVIFKGRVGLTSPQFNLTGEELVVYLGKDGSTFRLVEARGSVHVQLTGVPPEKRYRGQSSMAVYDPAKGTLVMTGWPKIQGQGREIVAAESSTRILLYPDTGKMLTEGRAQTRVAKQLMEEQTGASKK